MASEFPKWLYKGGHSVLVKDEKAEKALGAGWDEVPAQPKLEEPKKDEAKK